MAGTIVHLLVAEKLKEKLLQETWCYPEGMQANMKSDYFIAGNICPDGIMARKNYERDMKLHTHFRDGIPDGSFEKPGMVPLFERRMKAFWEEHLFDEKLCPGLYLGYVTHMMTDERFILEERSKFFDNIAVIGLTDKDRETFLRFNRETDLVDFHLLQDFGILQEARKALLRAEPYEIKGMITKEELTDSRNWILSYFFRQKHTIEETKYLKYEDMLQFIDKITEEIMERLFKEQYLLRQ